MKYHPASTSSDPFAARLGGSHCVRPYRCSGRRSGSPCLRGGSCRTQASHHCRARQDVSLHSRLHCTASTHPAAVLSVPPAPGSIECRLGSRLGPNKAPRMPRPPRPPSLRRSDSHCSQSNGSLSGGQQGEPPSLPGQLTCGWALSSSNPYSACSGEGRRSYIDAGSLQQAALRP